jgi:hypothetical protein
MRLGYVYLIGPETGPIKIGHATNIKSRLCSLQMGNWQQLAIHHSVSVPWTVAPTIEQIVHEQFDERRVRGEWFDVPLPVLKSSLDSVASQYLISRERADWFSTNVCYNLTDHPSRSLDIVTRYRNTANDLTQKAFIARVNRALLEEVGQAAYIMFQQVIVENRDISHALYRKPGLARQAEASLIKALNGLVKIWVKIENARYKEFLDKSQQTAA